MYNRLESSGPFLLHYTGCVPFATTGTAEPFRFFCTVCHKDQSVERDVPSNHSGVCDVLYQTFHIPRSRVEGPPDYEMGERRHPSLRFFPLYR